MLALPSSNSRRAASLRPGGNVRPPEQMMPHSGFNRGLAADHDLMPFNGGMGGMFDHMNRMMQEMQSLSTAMFQGVDSMFPSMGETSLGGAGGPQFFSRTIQQSTSYDPSGRPIVQSYQTQSYGSVDRDGTRVAERQQSYKNSATGLEKRALERKVGDKSRKVVEERVGNQERRSDMYRNMTEQDAQAFDRAWEERSRGLGFRNQQSLPAPSGQLYGREVARPAPRVREDDFRRGAYVPDQYKREDQPVRVRRDAPPTNALPAPRSDLQPTVPNGLRNYQAPAARPPPQRPRGGGRAGGTPMPGA